MGYAEYLQLPALLSLQRPLGAPRVADELLFIIVHQTHELWFKQLLQDLRLLVAHLDADAWNEAGARIQRLVRIVRLLVEHLEVLSTMPSSEFQAFRAALGTASGMQSEQYREIERWACGESGRQALVPGVGRSNVRFAFLHALGRARAGGRGLAPESEAGPAGALLAGLWHSADLVAERLVAKRLIELDDEMCAWRARHVTLARQMIGDVGGTGGSPGVRYLKGTAARRFFPELQASASKQGPLHSSADARQSSASAAGA